MPLALARFGVKWTMAIGLVALAVRYLTLWAGVAADTNFLYYIAILVHGIIFGFFFVGGQVYVDKKAPPEMRAQAQGLYVLLCYGVGQFVGTFVNVELIERYTTDGVCNWIPVFVIIAVISAVLLVALAAFFRLYRIEVLPPGDGHDPAAYGVDALQVLQGARPIFFSANYGREALFSYLVVPFVAAWGPTALAVHVASAIVGILTIPAVYLLAEELFAAYTTSEAAADERFGRKVLKLTGVVNRIEVKDYLDLDYINLTDTADNILEHVRCFFDKKHGPALSQLSIGDRVTVQGTYDGSMINMRLKDCVLAP